VDRRLKDGEKVRLGETELTVMHHPGHTKGATSSTYTTEDLWVRRCCRNSRHEADYTRLQAQEVGHQKTKLVRKQLLLSPQHDFRILRSRKVGSTVYRPLSPQFSLHMACP
jgi:hypothetical protein